MAQPKPKLWHRVFEARYERGWRYLDRCGEVLLIFEELLPSETQKIWLPEEVNPSGGRLKCPDLDVSIIFGPQSLVVQQVPVDADFDFDRLCDAVFATICARFDIRTIVRLGARRKLLLGEDSIEDAERHSVKRAPFEGWPISETHALKLKTCEATVNFEAPDGSTGLRFAMEPISRIDAPLEIDDRLRTPARLLPAGQREALIRQLQRQKQREQAPTAGLLLDTDYYAIRPKEPAIDSFLSTAWSESERCVAAFLEHRL